MPESAEKETASTPAREATAAPEKGTATALRFQTFVSLVQALAWPLIVVFVVLQFDAPVTQLLCHISSGTVKAGSVELTFVANAIVASGQKEISGQVTQFTPLTPLPVTSIVNEGKSGTSQIPLRIQEKIQALDFTIGNNNYGSDAIRAYLTSLIPYDFFKYIIFLQSDKTFFGMIEARTLVALLEDPQSGLTYESFAAAVNSGSDADRAQLSQLSGFVPKTESVDPQTQKRQVLERMVRGSVDAQTQKREVLERMWLPVVQADGRFQGVIDRTSLTASIVLDVTNRITTASSQAPAPASASASCAFGGTPGGPKP